MNRPPRVLICGSRAYENYTKIEKFVFSLPVGSVVIEGEAKGADTMARQAAEKKGIPEERILKFPANWEKNGKAAGPIRNKQMLVEGKPDVVVAFSDDIENSRGTKNMMDQAKKAGVSTFLNPEMWVTDIKLENKQ